MEDKEILDSDLDTVLHSVNGDQSILALAEEQDGQGEIHSKDLNDSVTVSQSGPPGLSNSPGSSSSTSAEVRRKKKALKDILPQTMEKCIETFLNYQKEVDKEILQIEKEQLKLQKENLEIQRQTLELLKRVFQ